VTSWLASKIADAPPALRERVVELVGELEQGDEDLPDRLALAAKRGLDGVLVHPGDRSVALDLLSADALITLALLHQAEQDPSGLGDYADHLVATSLESPDR